MNEEFITGFQYSPVTRKFIGEYSFPKNKDSDRVHIPPYTVLIPPPTDFSITQSQYWDGQGWEIMEDPEKTPPKPELIIEDYSVLTDAVVAEITRRGLWNDQHESLYQAAKALIQEQQIIAQTDQSTTDGQQVIDQTTNQPQQ